MFENLIMTLTDWIGRQGIWAPLVFVAIFVLSNFLFLPLLPFIIVGGFLLGTVTGTCAVSAATLISAMIAFWIGRHRSRSWMLKKFKDDITFRVIDDVVHNAGWKLVILSRLSALFPFTLLNFAYGLSKVKFRHYFLATWTGMLPGIYVWVSIGAAAGSWVGVHKNGYSAGQWLLLAVSSIASVSAAVYMTLLTREAFRKEAGRPPD